MAGFFVRGRDYPMSDSARISSECIIDPVETAGVLKYEKGQDVSNFGKMHLMVATCEVSVASYLSQEESSGVCTF